MDDPIDFLCKLFVAALAACAVALCWFCVAGWFHNAKPCHGYVSLLRHIPGHEETTYIKAGSALIPIESWKDDEFELVIKNDDGTKSTRDTTRESFGGWHVGDRFDEADKK